MIEIKSREGAIDAFGPAGAKAWGRFLQEQIPQWKITVFDCEFIRPAPKPLTDSEIYQYYLDFDGDIQVSIVAAAHAAIDRLAMIERAKSK